MPTSRFDRDTAVAPVGDGRYQGTIDPGWAVIDGAAPNGGYVMALAARAMRDPLPHPDPVTLTAHFLAPPEPGQVLIDIEVIRSGRRHSTVTARVVQDDRERVRLLGTFADLSVAYGDDPRVDRSPPAYPPIEDCVDATTTGADRASTGGYPAPPILLRFDHRMPREMTTWADGLPLGRGQVGGYVDWADGGPMDTLGLIAVADCYPPAVFNTGDSSLRWVPTIELTVQIRRRPAPGYLTTRFTTEAITAGGYLEEDGDLWDADGRLVALSRQLALAPR
jgi:hypothetical protein